MKKILLFTLLFAALAACKKEETYEFPLSVDFTVSEDKPVADKPLVFALDIKGGKFPYTYSWDFSDGMTGSELEESVTYSTPGSKTVTVKVTDSKGEVASAEKTIVIRDLLPSISVSPDFGVLTPESLEIKISIVSNTSWKVTGKPEWVTVAPESGNGTAEISVSAARQEEAISGKITFETTHSADNVSDEIEISYNPSVNPLQTPTLLAKEETWNSLFYRWEEVSGTSTYYFELAKADKPGVPVNIVKELDFANNYSYKPAVVMGHLEPETDYIFRVKAVAKDGVHTDSEYLEYSFTTPAEPDDSRYILCERFDNFVWEMDYIRQAWGFYPSSIPEKESNTIASLDEPADKYRMPGSSQLNFAFGSGSYFSESFVNTQWELEGWDGARCHSVFGMLKLGNWKSKEAYVQTPALSKISGTQDVRLSITYAPWWDPGKTSHDSAKITVEVTGGGTVETVSLNESFNVPCPLKTVSTVIRGATSGTRIKITPDLASNGHRLMIDAITVEAL